MVLVQGTWNQSSTSPPRSTMGQARDAGEARPVHREVEPLGSRGRPVDVESNVCPVCLDELSYPIVTCIGKSCKNEFHKRCILRWAAVKRNATCPTCRISIQVD